MKSRKIEPRHTKNARESRKTLRELLLYEAKEFCLRTALHGYRFIVLPKRILLERAIWAAICVLSLIGVAVCLCKAWFDFQKNPIGSVTGSTHNPIWNYVFPAVTVCSHNKISRERAYHLAELLAATTRRDTNRSSAEELIHDVRLLFQSINYDNNEIPNENYTRLNNLLQKVFFGSYVDAVLQYLAPPCQQILLRCKWKGKETRCGSIFELVRTSQGFCCSFNYYALKNHTFAGLFAGKAPKKPRRVTGCGYLTGLEIMLKNDPGDYFASDIPSIGYRVFIHNSHYFLDNNSEQIMVGMGSVNLIEVTPLVTYSTKGIKDLPLSKRHCLFPNERVLTSYEQYTYHNCMVECKMNMTLRFCKCLPYKYIHSEDSNQVVCSPEDLPCLMEYQSIIESSIPGVNISQYESYIDYGSENSECACLPDCEIMDYASESSVGKLSRHHSTNDPAFFGGLHIENQSVVKVYFSDLMAKTVRWEVAFNWQTLLAYYGGLLGLFVGFSFVSGLEIIFFFTVRLISDAYKNKKHQTGSLKKHRPLRKSKNATQPIQHHLDPKLLLIPSNVEMMRFKRNSYFFN